MSEESTAQKRTKCYNCGFEAPVGSDAWETADHPSLGTLTRCPECGSTDTVGIDR